MDIIYLLLPIVLVMAGVLGVFFFWAVKSDQFDDLEGPAYRILMDDDKPPAKKEDKDKEESDTGNED